jgi:hypothetical protein
MTAALSDALAILGPAFGVGIYFAFLGAVVGLEGRRRR